MFIRSFYIFLPCTEKKVLLRSSWTLKKFYIKPVQLRSITSKTVTNRNKSTRTEEEVQYNNLKYYCIKGNYEFGKVIEMLHFFKDLIWHSGSVELRLETFLAAYSFNVLLHNSVHRIFCEIYWSIVSANNFLLFSFIIFF